MNRVAPRAVDRTCPHANTVKHARATHRPNEALAGGPTSEMCASIGQTRVKQAPKQTCFLQRTSHNERIDALTKRMPLPNDETSKISGSISCRGDRDRGYDPTVLPPSSCTAQAAPVVCRMCRHPNVGISEVGLMSNTRSDTGEDPWSTEKPYVARPLMDPTYIPTPDARHPCRKEAPSKTTAAIAAWYVVTYRQPFPARRMASAWADIGQLWRKSIGRRMEFTRNSTRGAMSGKCSSKIAGGGESDLR